MANAALLLAPQVPVPRALPREPRRVTPYEQAVHDHERGPWPREADHPDPFGHQPARDAALQALLACRGLRWHTLRSGPQLAFLAHSAKADAFNFGEHRGDELGLLRQLAHAYGGDHVALWTWGQAVHVWIARSAGPGGPPQVMECSVRIEAPRDSGRPAGLAGRIAHWLEGSALAPPREALRRVLSAPVLSVPELFAVFGIPGAQELAPPDGDAAWTSFAQVADTLLRGEDPEPAARQRVNEWIDAPEDRLPAHPVGKRGGTARRVAAAFLSLRAAVGEPTTERLAACASVVPPVLGRLHAHDPLQVRHDPIFLALASHAAEACNGHDFADPLATMAESVAARGFKAVAVPAAREDELVDSFARWFARARGDATIAPGEAGEPAVPQAALAAQLAAVPTTPLASLLERPWPRRDERLAWLLELPTRDEHSLAALARDLRSLVQPECCRFALTQDGAQLWMHTGEDTRDAQRIALLLADLPAGTRIALAQGEQVTLLRIAPQAARPPDPLPRPGPGWRPPQVLLETGDHVIATADLARLSWYREDGRRIARRLAALYPGRIDGAQAIAAADALALVDGALRGVGFEAIGEVLATHLPGVGVRAYTHRDGTSTAIVVLVPGRPLLECEIQTRLADGTEVITSSLAEGQAKPGASLRRLSAGVAALWEAHGRHLAEVRAGRAPEPAPATLAEFARLLA